MKTEKTMKMKTPTVTKAAPAQAANGLETSRNRKRTLKVATPEPPTAQPTRTETRSPRDISSDMIAARAYIIWEQQGRPQGRDVANWLLAESQLKQEHSFSA